MKKVVTETKYVALICRPWTTMDTVRAWVKYLRDTYKQVYLVVIAPPTYKSNEHPARMVRPADFVVMFGRYESLAHSWKEALDFLYYEGVDAAESEDPDSVLMIHADGDFMVNVPERIATQDVQVSYRDTMWTGSGINRLAVLEDMRRQHFDEHGDGVEGDVQYMRVPSIQVARPKLTEPELREYLLRREDAEQKLVARWGCSPNHPRWDREMQYLITHGPGSLKRSVRA